MFYELIATVAVAFGAAGMVMLVNRLVGRRLPKWALPAAAGLSMIAFTIWSEYSWADRTINGLPEGLAVVQTIDESTFWKPWTYIKPMTPRLIVADLTSIQSNDVAPAIRLVDLYLFERWEAPNQVPQLVDCETGSRADVTDQALADPSKAVWRPINPGNDIKRVVCTK